MPELLAVDCVDSAQLAIAPGENPRLLAPSPGCERHGQREHLVCGSKTPPALTGADVHCKDTTGLGVLIAKSDEYLRSVRAGEKAR